MDHASCAEQEPVPDAVDPIGVRSTASAGTALPVDAIGTLSLAEIIEGLSASPPQLPAKAFYDACGAELFERITELDEYYPTRTEREILVTRARDIAAAVGEGSVLIEYGSGAADKTRIILRALRPRMYVPVDVSAEQLSRVAGTLGDEFPEIAIRPLLADFTQSLVLPDDVMACDAPRVALFLGSTIGNFHPEQAARFVRQVRRAVGPQGRLLMGADLRKSVRVLHAAYNDASGVTATFNRNVLRRLHRDFSARVDADAFAHYAFYEPTRGRIEMHLLATRDTSLEIGGRTFHFGAGEGIWTESSYKFTRSLLAQLGADAGMAMTNLWTDRRRWFSVVLYGGAESV